MACQTAHFGITRTSSFLGPHPSSSAPTSTTNCAVDQTPVWCGVNKCPKSVGPKSTPAALEEFGTLVFGCSGRGPRPTPNGPPHGLNRLERGGQHGTRMHFLIDLSGSRSPPLRADAQPNAKTFLSTSPQLASVEIHCQEWAVVEAESCITGGQYTHTHSRR